MGKAVDRIYHAAIYVRLSKEDGDVAGTAKAESNSISNQKDLIRDFLKDKDDIIVVSERVADGYSGSNFDLTFAPFLCYNYIKFNSYFLAVAEK